MTAKARIILVIALLTVAGLLAASRKPAKPTGPAVDPSRSPSSTAPGWFVNRAAAAGIGFQLGHHGKTPLTLLETIGTGCAAVDFDGDGHADIFLIGQEGTGNTGRCALYRNNGDGTFTDVTKGSGLEQPGTYTGCAVGDFDNDGLPDLLVTGYGVVRLYRNLGHFKFQDVTKGSGLESPSPFAWNTSAGVADIDHNGLLDIYIGRYVIFDNHTQQLCDYGKYKSACGPMFYDPNFGSGYKNLGHFHFKDMTRAWGLNTAHGKCLGVAFADVNGDGWPDLYVGNDEEPGDLFINDHGDGFHNVGAQAGVALSSDAKVQGAMGVDLATSTIPGARA